MGYLTSPSQTEKFDVLRALVGLVPDLADTLDDPRNRLTLLPPTDSAFLRLARKIFPVSGLNRSNTTGIVQALAGGLALLANSTSPAAKYANVDSILRYHLITEAYPFQELEKNDSVSTALGKDLEFKSGRVIDADDSRNNSEPRRRNVFTQNGWIHVMSSVLLPFDLDAAVNGGSPNPSDDPNPSDGPEPSDDPKPSGNAGIPRSAAQGVNVSEILVPRISALQYLQSQPRKFGVLVRAVSSIPELASLLDDVSQAFTLFPPTDSAFLKVVKIIDPTTTFTGDDKDGIFGAIDAAIEPLSGSNLFSILNYHSIASPWPYEKLVEARTLLSTDTRYNLTFRNNKVVDRDGSRRNAVPDPRNVLAANAWIHVIDSVLLPFNLDNVLNPEVSPQASPDFPQPSVAPPGAGGVDISEGDDLPEDDIIIPSPRLTVLDYLVSEPDKFGILVKAANAVPGIPALLGQVSERFTLFAPTDEAFAKLANQLSPGRGLTADDKDAVLKALGDELAQLGDVSAASLQAIVKYHVLTQAWAFQKLPNRPLRTKQGRRLEVNGNRVIDFDDSRADAVSERGERNVLAVNGWVHAVDSVLLPFDLDNPTGSPGPSIEPSIEPSMGPNVGPSGFPDPSDAGTAGATVSASTNSPDEDDSVCFPSTATVRLADGSVLKMSELQAGHSIHIGSEKTSAVFAFTHRTMARKTAFYELTTASGHSVSMTGQHYVYANEALTAAAAVRQGDVLQTAAGQSRVVRVRVVMGTGLFAPHTLHGDIEVDGVVVSGYSRAVHPKVAHALLAPIRALCRYGGFVEPLGGMFYEGADSVASYMPKGASRY